MIMHAFAGEIVERINEGAEELDRLVGSAEQMGGPSRHEYHGACIDELVENSSCSAIGNRAWVSH